MSGDTGGSGNTVSAARIADNLFRGCRQPERIFASIR